jgi:hypothetical protein
MTPGPIQNRLIKVYWTYLSWIDQIDYMGGIGLFSTLFAMTADCHGFRVDAQELADWRGVVQRFRKTRNNRGILDSIISLHPEIFYEESIENLYLWTIIGFTSILYIVYDSICGSLSG